MFCQEDLKFAYDWMAEQMRMKIGAPPVGVHYPVWAWYQWKGRRSRRDLRRSGYAARGTPMVQIEFEIDDDWMLLSDFDDWCWVLSNSYIADSEQEYNEFYSSAHQNIQAKIESSWIKVFDMERYVPDWTAQVDEKSIQATLWEINLAQVKKVEHFIAK